METLKKPYLVDCLGKAFCFKHAVMRAQKGENISLVIGERAAGSFAGCPDCFRGLTNLPDSSKHIDKEWLTLVVWDAYEGRGFDLLMTSWDAYKAEFVAAQKAFIELPQKERLGWDSVVDRILVIFKHNKWLAEGVSCGEEKA